MMTPPLSICARPAFMVKVGVPLLAVAPLAGAFCWVAIVKRMCKREEKKAEI